MKSTWRYPLLPPGHVTATIDGSSRCAASAVFSPSTSTTIASGLSWLDVEIDASGISDTRPALEVLNGAKKPEAPIFHEPPDYIAVPAAAEAIGMAIGINSVRWAALKMKRAKRNIFTTGAL